MSSFVADPTEGPLSPNHASAPGPYTAVSLSILNQESLSDKGPNEAFVSGLQPSFDAAEATCNDPSDIKAYSTNIKTESDTNHEEISPLGVSASRIAGPGKSAIEGNSFPDTPPRKTSPPPTSLDFSVEKGQNFPTGGSDIPTSSEATLSTFAEKELHASDTTSISSPTLHMVGGAQIAAEKHKNTNSFDIFDSDDHDTLGNGRRHSVDSTFIGNGLASPEHCCVSPPPDGHLVTPAPKKIASLLTPPPSGEKTSVTSASLQEMVPDVSSSEKKTLFTLPNEENPNDDVHTLERNDLPALPHEAGHNGNIYTSEQNGLSTPLHEENSNGDVHTLEQNDISTFSHDENHSGHITQSEEGRCSTLSQSNCSGDIHTLERNYLPALPHEVGHNGDTHTSQQNHLSAPLHEENRLGGVTRFQESSYSTPHENCDGDVHAWEPDNRSTLSREGNHNSDGAGPGESDYYTLPHENCDGDSRTWERDDLSVVLHEENHSGGVARFEENNCSTLPYENCDGDVHAWERDNLSTLSHEGSHNGDGAGFEVNGYSTLPHENCDGDVHTLEPKDLPTLPHEESRRDGVALLEGNAHFTLPHEESYGGDVTPFKENYHFTLPHEEGHCEDAHTPDKAPCEPYDASKITNIREQNSGPQLRGDYWRPSITDSRARSRCRDSYRHRETGGSDHQFRSSVRHPGDRSYSGYERDRRPRSRSPTRDIKRGRFRDLSPPRRSLHSLDGLHGLSGSNASHQTEDKSGWHRFGNQTFKGDRYIPSPQPIRPARRSPAPSPGRELTPPRRTPRNASRSRLPPPTLPERRSGRQPEYTPRKAHPTRSSGALPDQSTAFQNSIRAVNTSRRDGAGSAFEGGHPAGMRNSNYVHIPTSPKRPEKRRRHEDEPPVQNKRSRRDEQAHNGGGMRDYRAPRSSR